MKKVANVFTAPAKHWVGNGFHVASMFSYNDCNQSLKMRNKETNRDLAGIFGNKRDEYR